MPSAASAPSIALAHHWLMSMRGGEKALAAMADLFPDAPIYTLLANHAQLNERLLRHPIRTSWLQRFSWIPNLQRKALPVLASASRSLDASGHDVVICSDAAIIKAIRARGDTLKICYCYSPMRYIWDLYAEYHRAAGIGGRLGLRWCAPRLRRADRLAAQDVAAFVAISRHVADRIRRHYDLPSVVIPPPVDVDFPPADSPPEDFYLVVSELVPYKRVDLAVEACTRLSRPLVVIGTGPQASRLRASAGPTVRMLGWQDDAAVRDHFRRCRALLFCGEEDFGLTPVECQAAGRPVIAYRLGGATETVRDGETGLFFDRPDADSLIEAIRRFESGVALRPPAELQHHARQFSTERFMQRFRHFVDFCLDCHHRGGPDELRRAMQEVPANGFL